MMDSKLQNAETRWTISNKEAWKFTIVRGICSKATYNLNCNV